ncbi:MAG: RNA 2',3'-cyclic phosphodiesterase [Candidatus Dojkabacteria bacterium]|nr:RNA 2',3'-cyclic phosphodiesterase [Candidatus Dojkabacteria bacterium]MDQ7021629.1 RNA 2',3'-cyclic phosphodiesterase [Candidatus Dojkabacteria bacterium]
MRLFLAVFPPKEYLDYFRDTLRRYAKEKRNLKHTPVDQMHLTVKFIGPRVSLETKDYLVEEFKKREDVFKPIKLHISSVKLGFKMQNIKQKRILMARLRQNDSFNNLVKDTHSVIKELKISDTIYWKQKYSINNHITLSRLKNTATTKNSKEIIKMTEGFKIPNFKPAVINEMYFVESIIQPDFSPIYRKLERIELKGIEEV